MLPFLISFFTPSVEALKEGESLLFTMTILFSWQKAISPNRRKIKIQKNNLLTISIIKTEYLFSEEG
jgi:hypothetical protein